MSDTNDNGDHVLDVMDLMSTGDDIDMTHEEESLLLMNSSPTKRPSMANTSTTDDHTIDMTVNECIARKPIVFDLKESSHDESSQDDCDKDLNTRDKFSTERTTISFKPMAESTARQIPDSLDDIGRQGMRQFKRKRGGRKNRRQSSGGHPYGRQLPPMQPSLASRLNRLQPNSDLRDFISRPPNQLGRHETNQLMMDTTRVLQNQINNLSNNLISNLSPVLNLQMDLGILDPNRLLVNALLAQSQTNCLANRLAVLPTAGLNNTSTLNAAPKLKDNIKITIANNSRPAKSTMMSTKPQYRCLVSNTPSESSQSNSSQELSQFSRPAVNGKQSGGASNGDSFMDALTEAEVGVDNEYLARLREQQEQREQLKRLKEQRRLEMADERLESANQLKQQIANKRHNY